MKNLGVFDCKLPLNNHIGVIIQTAFKYLIFINKHCKDLSVNSYCALVRLDIEYASIIWSPFYLIHISEIESVQKRFLSTSAFKMMIVFDDFHIRIGEKT